METIRAFGDTEELFRQAKEQDIVAMEMLRENGVLFGLGLAWKAEDKTKAFCIFPEGFVTEAYLMDKAEDLCAHTAVASLDVKSMLRYMELKSHKGMFDGGIASYLLNPLKSSYT